METNKMATEENNIYWWLTKMATEEDNVYWRQW